MNRQPLISIITVCLNAGQVIEKTIRSVTEQNYPNIEYIIVDGVSTDNTSLIVEKYKNKISRFIQESDRGLYDAMNKGMRMASGEYINFMNAGDTFSSEGTLREVFSKAPEEADVIYGDYIHLARAFKVYIKSKPLERLWVRPRFCHQSAFYRRELLMKYPFSGRYIASDVEQAYDMYRDGAHFYNTNVLVALFDSSGISGKSISRISREMRRIVLSRDYKRSSRVIFFLYGFRFFLLESIRKLSPVLFDNLYKFKVRIFLKFGKKRITD